MLFYMERYPRLRETMGGPVTSISSALAADAAHSAADMVSSAVVYLCVQGARGQLATTSQSKSVYYCYDRFMTIFD